MSIFLLMVTTLMTAVGSVAQAQGVILVERVIEVKTSEKNPALARPQLMNTANDEVSELLIKEIIGEAKFSRNRAILQQKVMKKAASYLPFSKAGELKETENGFQMAVTVRANLDDLQKLLLENGLFYETDSTPTVLPVVRWMDQVHSQRFGWWMGTPGADRAFLAKESRFVESSIHAAFLKSGFYVIRPQILHYVDLLSASERSETPSPENVSNWARAWNAQVALQGQVTLAKGERSETTSIEIRLTAVQVVNQRVVAEVARQFESEPGVFGVVVDAKLNEAVASLSQDLASQVLEAWKQGTINSQRYRLRVLGRLPIPLQEGFKEALRNKTREIKFVRERLIASDEISYEIDASVSPIEIAKKLEGLEVDKVRFAVKSANEKELTLTVVR